MFDNPPTVMAQIRAGGLRALGVASKSRIPQLPDVPTISEGGVPGFEASSWFGLVAPAKTPRAIVERVAADTARALKEPELQERFGKLGARLAGDTPDQFAKRVVEERARWREVVKAANIRLQ